ncbi:MAG: hypothetical protein IPG29_12860 [Sphingobacteriales bacterium]|nr:hypothetical protein [Sphingobacteriales bacterium]
MGERIFTKLFTNGDGKYNLTDRSQIQHGYAPRTYSNFADMSMECANSRLYGGIHYQMDNTNGLLMGRSIGNNVLTAIEWPANLN